ncbi:MAG: hypothetical protein AB1465_05040 [Patescibacteria group bacterium]
MRKIQFLFFVFFLRFGFGVFEEEKLFAQESGQNENLELSRQHNENGAKLFGKGEFCQAAEEFEKALRAFSKPEAVFNAAFAWEKCGEIGKALGFYQEYLKTAPNNEREQIAAKIKELEKKIAEKIKNEREEEREESAVRIVTEKPRIPSSPYRTWKWVSTVSTVSFFGLALGLNLDAVNRAGKINNRPLATANDWKRYHSDFNSAKREQMASYVFYGLAGATAVVSVILWYLDSRDEQANLPVVSFAPAPVDFGRGIFSISF